MVAAHARWDDFGTEHRNGGITLQESDSAQ